MCLFLNSYELQEKTDALCISTQIDNSTETELNNVIQLHAKYFIFDRLNEIMSGKKE